VCFGAWGEEKPTRPNPSERGSSFSKLKFKKSSGARQSPPPF
jgi:hypothetical protein